MTKIGLMRGMKNIKRSIEINNQSLTLEFGKHAQQATSSVLASLGETTVLITVVAGGVREGIDYFPLSVEYVEKLYAGGRIKGSRWVKKEGRPRDEAILNGRLIDRSIRPLFPKNYRRDVQIVVTTLAVDGVNSPEIVGAIGVSAALHVSSIPFKMPISTMRVGYLIDASGQDSFIVNPSSDQHEYSSLDLVVSSTKEKVLMIETLAQILSEDVLFKAIQEAKKENTRIIEFIESIRKEIGQEKEVVLEESQNKDLEEYIAKTFQDELVKVMKEMVDKESGESVVTNQILEKLQVTYGEDYDEASSKAVVDYLVKQLIRNTTLDTKIRADGRSLDQIRSLSAEVSTLPRVHGDGLFQRGDTQVLSIATLAAPGQELLIEGPEGEVEKHYIHHYNFPPYSVGETGRIGFSSRREIGHGALAEKALEPVIPSQKQFPYMIRVVSEVLSSNGSTSMASTCGSSLALMDAGVPIKAPVAGIAMGIITRSDDDYVILTDIMGLEDFSGEMDFKVTGTTEGITAVQLDVKNLGLTDKMIAETLEKAKKARLQILEVMNNAITEPRTQVSQYAPRVVILHPPEDKIGEIIGPGGKNIRSIIAKTNTEINVSDSGEVTIAGVDAKKVEEAQKMIEIITKDVEIEEVYEGEVKRILPFGAFVELLPGKEGLVHVSKMSDKFVKDPRDIVKEGETVKVRVVEIDDQGRVNLEMVR